ncbi:MAG: P-loop NTPase [Acidobacteriota bacterium]|nr:P-loop NTPase [Acidobacteriota bacterium]
MTKTYKEIQGDGGSDVAGQIAGLQGRLRDRMAAVKCKIAVMSGKGGVGKSTVTANLAAALAARGAAVGVLDADVYGPSLAQMFGLRGRQLTYDSQGVQPPVTASGIKVMSMDFFLADGKTPVVWDGPQQEAFAWKGMLEMHTLREFLTDTDWGELDYLLIDLPPGTSQFATLTDLLGKPDGTVVISIPTAVSRLVVQRSISMITEVLKLPVLGVVENMSAYYCGGCDSERPLFNGPEITDYGGTPVLGRIPFDPRMAEASDAGTPFVESHALEPPAAAFLTLATELKTRVSPAPA